VRFGVVSMTVCSVSSEGPPTVRTLSPEFPPCLCLSDQGAARGGLGRTVALAGRVWGNQPSDEFSFHFWFFFIYFTDFIVTW
jgi:hypothetical protein